LVVLHGVEEVVEEALVAAEVLVVVVQAGRGKNEAKNW
jgi:hypothetical protein